MATTEDDGGRSERDALAREVVASAGSSWRSGLPWRLRWSGWPHGRRACLRSSPRSAWTSSSPTASWRFSATRHLSLDGYEQDQTVVLAHYQDENAASAGLRISDRPLDLSMLEAFAELGWEPGPSREELQAALASLPDGRAPEEYPATLPTSPPSSTTPPPDRPGAA